MIQPKKLATPKNPVFRKPEPEAAAVEPGEKKKKGKKGSKKKKKKKDKLKNTEVSQPKSDSDVLESISKELENISEQISENKD